MMTLLTITSYALCIVSVSCLTCWWCWSSVGKQKGKRLLNSIQV